MADPIRILIIEDSEDDTLLMLRRLRRDGLEVESRLVDDEEGMRSALGDGEWDVVVCDYALPGFGAHAALSIMEELGLDVPLIVVSGTIRMADAVALMKAGAHDFVEKHDLARLVPAIERGLRETEIRRERSRAASALRESEARFRDVSESVSDWIWEFGPDLRFTWISPRIEEIFGRPPDHYIGKTLEELEAPEDDRGEWVRQMENLRARRPLEAYSYRRVLDDGTECHFVVSGKPIAGRAATSRPRSKRARTPPASRSGSSARSMAWRCSTPTNGWCSAIRAIGRGAARWRMLLSLASRSRNSSV